MKNRVSRWRRPPARKARVLVGAIHWQYALGVQVLQRGATQQLLDRAAGPGGRVVQQALAQRTLAPASPTVLLASIGTDAEGRALRRCLRRRRIQLPWLSVGDVATSVSYAIEEETSGLRTTLVRASPRVPSVPPMLLEQSLAKAEACCLVDPANVDEIPLVLRSAAQAQVPVFFIPGEAQIGLLGYRGLAALLEEEVEVLLCSRLEALRLTNCEDVSEQLAALHFDGQVRTVAIVDGLQSVHASCDGKPCSEPPYLDLRRPLGDEALATEAGQAALVDALLRGRPLAAALRSAARQAFEVSVRQGPALLDAKGMEAYLSAEPKGAGRACGWPPVSLTRSTA